MKGQQLSSWLLVFIVFVFSCQEIWAATVMKGSKAKNNTTTNKQLDQTTKQPKVVHKIKTTSTTTTTVKPKLENKTLASDLDLDGRSAFINNRFVSEAEEPISYTPTPLHDLLQQQIQTVLTDTVGSYQTYNNNTTPLKEALYNDHVQTQKLSKKPLINYDMSKFDDYEEEGTGEVGFGSDCMHENCQNAQEIHEREKFYNSQSNLFEKTIWSKPYDFSPQTNAELGTSYDNNNNQNKLNETSAYVQLTTINQSYDDIGGSISEIKPKPVNEYNTQRYYGQTNPIEQYLQAQKISLNQYVQSKPVEHYGYDNKSPLTHQYSSDKQQQNQKTHYIIDKNTQPLLNYQKPTQNTKIYNKQHTKQNHNNPASIFYNKPLYNNNYTTATTLFNYYNNQTDSLHLPDKSNLSYGNYNMETSSPISSVSMRNKKFKTVSSSVQYVSTPLVDLVFKYSIGISKHSKMTNSSSHIFNASNDIDSKAK